MSDDGWVYVPILACGHPPKSWEPNGLTGYCARWCGPQEIVGRKHVRA